MEKEEEKSLKESIFTLKKVTRELKAAKNLQIEDNPKKFLFYNFLFGVARGIGFAVGVSLIFALMVWILSKLTLVPFLGNWIISILDYIERTKIY